jgi:hypothetical protein
MALPSDRSLVTDSGTLPWRTSRLAMAASIVGMLALVALFSGYSFGQYGIRKFELYAGVLRAQLAANAFAFVGLAFLLSLSAIVLGHVAGWRIRRRSNLVGAG